MHFHLFKKIVFRQNNSSAHLAHINWIVKGCGLNLISQWVQISVTKIILIHIFYVF